MYDKCKTALRGKPNYTACQIVCSLGKMHFFEALTILRNLCVLHIFPIVFVSAFI